MNEIQEDYFRVVEDVKKFKIIFSLLSTREFQVMWHQSNWYIYNLMMFE